MLMSLAALPLSACSLLGDKPPEYLTSQDGKPLQVPEDLDEPRRLNPVLINVGQMRLPSGDELNPAPPRTVSTAGRDANAFLAWSAEGVYLKVEDTPASVARRLGFVIERSGMNMLERGDGGAYRFEYVHPITDERGFFGKLLFWRDNDAPDYSGAYRTRVVEDDGQARVYLLYDSGRAANTASAEHILGIFMERLG
jgi:uncharacterized lipoprotein